MQKNFLFRLSARVCIVSLLYQSLWPSIVMAKEMDPLPLHSFSLRHNVSLKNPPLKPSPLQNYPPKYTIQIQSLISQSKTSSSQPFPKLLLRIFQGPSQKLHSETWFKPSQKKSPENVIEIIQGKTSLGILWSTAIGYFAIGWDGSLVLQGKSSKPINTPIAIQTHGGVALSQFQAKTLHLKARQVSIDSESYVQNLSLALGTQKQPGVFEIHEKGAFQTKLLTLLRGSLVNRGGLIFEDGGFCDLGGGNPLLNFGEIEGLGSLDIWHGGYIGLYGPLKAKELSLQSQILDNRDTIQATTLKILLSQGGRSTGNILSEKETTFVSLGAFTNTGTMESKTKQGVYVLGHFMNAGSLIAPNQVVRVGSTLENTGRIEGSILYVIAPILAMEGTIKALDTLTLQIGKGTSTGEIYGKKKVDIFIDDSFLNRGGIGSEGTLTFHIAKTFYNLKDVVADQILYEGPGMTHNAGTQHAKQGFTLSSGTFINYQLTKSDQDFTIAGSARVINKSIISAKRGLITGTGEVVNASGTTTEPVMDFEGGLTFDNYQGNVKNAGKFSSRGSITGFLKNLLNEGIFETLKKYNLTIYTLCNRKDIRGSGIIKVHEGENWGQIGGQGLVIDVMHEMTNKGTLDILHLIGSGRFVNQATLLFQGNEQNPSFVRCREFENSVDENLSGTVKGKKVIFDQETWLNGDKATIEVDDIVFEAKKGTAINEGHILTKKLTLRKEGFQNRDTIQTDILILSAATFLNESGADLDVFQRTTFNTQKIINRGNLHLRGVTTGTLNAFHNQKTGEARFEGKTDLTGDTLTNEGFFMGKGTLGWVLWTLLNEHTFSVEISGITALHQIINKGAMSLYGGETRFWHFVNLRRLEWGKELYSGKVDLTKLLPLPTDRSTVFKKGYFENRGEVVSQKGAHGLRMRATELLNAGKVTVEQMNFDLKRLTNLKGKVIQGYHDLTGRVETLDNQGIFQSVLGRVDLKGQTATNTGKLAAGEVVRLTLTGDLINKGPISAKRTHLTAANLPNTGDIVASPPETSKTSSETYSVTLNIAGKIDNRGRIQAEKLGITATDLINHDTLIGTKTSTIRLQNPFRNEKKAVAQLTGLILEQNGSSTLKNAGTLVLEFVYYLADIENLVNERTGKLSLKYSFLEFKSLTSAGYLELFNSRIEGIFDFLPTATTRFGEGAEIIYQKFKNLGELQSKNSLVFDGFGDPDTLSLGKVKIKGDITLQVDQQVFEDVITGNRRGKRKLLGNPVGFKIPSEYETLTKTLYDQITHMSWTGTLTVDTLFFCNPQDFKFDVPGSLQINTAALYNSGTIQADKLTIRIKENAGVNTDTAIAYLPTHGSLLRWPEDYYYGFFPQFAGNWISKCLYNFGDIFSRGILDIEVPWDIWNRIGHIGGAGKTRVISTKGIIFNGEPYNYSSCGRGFIASGDSLELSGVSNFFGTLYAHGPLKLTGGLAMRGGLVWSDASGFIKGGGGLIVSCGDTTDSPTHGAQGGLIYIGNSYPGSKGDLILDTGVDVLGAQILAAGWIYDGPNAQLVSKIGPGETFSGMWNLSVMNSQGGIPGLIMSLAGFKANPFSFTNTGSVQSKNIDLSVGSFRIENVDDKRNLKSFGQALVIHLTSLAIERFVTYNGLIKEYEPSAPHHYGFNFPIPQEPNPALNQLVYLGDVPPPDAKVRFALDSKTRQIAFIDGVTRHISLKGLESDIMAQLMRNAQLTGKKFLNPYEVPFQTASMLLWIARSICNAKMTLNRTKRDVQSSFQYELDPVVVISPEDQRHDLLDSGTVYGQNDLKLFSYGKGECLGGKIEGDKVDVQGHDLLFAVKKKTVTQKDGDTTITEEVPGTIPEVIAHTKGTIGGRNKTHLVGAKMSSKDLTLGTSTGKTVVEPLILEKTTEKTGETTHTQEKSQTVIPSVVLSPGNVTHPGDVKLTGALYDVKGKLSFQGDVLAEALVLQHEVEGQMVGKHRQESYHAVDVQFMPTVLKTGTLSFTGSKVEMYGVQIDSKTVEDQSQKLTLGMKTGTSQQQTFQSRKTFFGKAKKTQTLTQEVGCPTQLHVDSWQSLGQGEAIYESVLAVMDTFYTQKNVTFKTKSLKTTQEETLSKSGFIPPKLQDPLLQSIDGIGGKQHPSDLLANGLKTTSEAIGALLTAKKLFEGSFMPLLGRYMTVSVGTEKHRGTFEEKLAQPNIFKAEVMVFENGSTHLEGEITAKELVVLSDTFTTGSPQDEMQATEESESSSVGVNLITRMPVLSMSQSESQTEKTKHKLTKINAETIFIRVDDMVVSGTQIRAKLIDAVIKKSLTIESLLDTFHQTRESVSLSTTGDFRVGDEEIVKKTINAIASFIGTEQFYLEVGGTLLTRSGEFGLKPDGVIAPHVKTQEGKTLYIRKMPTFQSNDGFFALLDHTGTKHPRQDAAKLLLDNAGDESIRTLVASVITGEEVLTLPGALPLHKAYRDAEENLKAMVEAANIALGLAGKTAQDLIALDPDETDPRLDLVRETFGILNEVKDRLTTWSKSQATFEAFIKDIVSKPGYGLKPNGLMQAIAKLSGRNVVIYQDQGGTAKPVHTYTYNTSSPTISALYTKDGKGNHFSLLEDTVTKVNAKEIKREYLEETDQHDGFVMNLPLGTAMTLMGQIDELRELQTQVYEQSIQEGLDVDQAMDKVQQVSTKLLESKEEIQTKITEALTEQGATPEDVETILQDEGMQKLIGQSAAFGEMVTDSCIRFKFKIDGEFVPMTQTQTGEFVRETMDPEHSLVRTGLTLLTRGAAKLDTLAQEHPVLANLSLTALQVTLAGPAGYVRNQVVEFSGLQAKVDTFVEDSKVWMKGYLTETHHVKPFLAEVFTEGGAFGLILGMSLFGGLPKEKILDAAKNVGKAVKKAQSLKLLKSEVKLGKDQPWTIRPGQEWKAKYFGKAHGKTPGHKVKSYKEGLKFKDSPDVESVHFNQGVSGITGIEVIPNNRPDVTVIKKNGKVDMIEVKSKTDRELMLEARMDKAQRQLPPQMQGKKDVVLPTQNPNPNGGKQ